MQYIRTKEGKIIDTTNKFFHLVETKEQYEKKKKRIKNDFSCCETISFIENDIWFRFFLSHGGEKEIKEEIKQADTIEELCDWFVLKIDGKMKICYDNLDNAFACEGNDIGRYEIYGALDTEKGLIYVAKMNDKGELDLL